MTNKAKQDKGLQAEAEKQVKEVKREWKHFRRFKDENHLLFAAFVVVLTSIVVLNAVYVISNSNTQDQPSQTQDNSSQVLTSMQSGSNPAQKVSISKVTENDKMDYAFTIDPAETMLIMDISITNNSTDTQQLVPVNQFYVRSNEGDYSALHASMYVKTPLQAQELAPGKTAKGELSFNVPKKEVRPLLYVDTGWGNYTPIVFDVLH